jgi:hypothetical protein
MDSSREVTMISRHCKGEEMWLNSSRCLLLGRSPKQQPLAAGGAKTEGNKQELADIQLEPPSLARPPPPLARPLLHTAP